MSVLDRVDSPADLRGLNETEMVELAAEIRAFLIEKVSATGGHLGPNLGVVELTLALHRVFESPTDPILFDTGHQCYVHKIVTGRKNRFDTLRQRGGLTGYQDRHESPHDWIESSHASAALSTADGLAKAFDLTGQERTVVAVVGDGALTGGMCWEALNNIADGDRPVVIVVNDNGRSYAPTVGVPQAMFSDPGIEYVGPVDGHDRAALEEAFTRAKNFGGSVIVHTVTCKGMGYAPAENDVAEQMHATGKMDPVTGRSHGSTPEDWTSVFSAELLKQGAARPEVVAITAAMPGPTGLRAFGEEYPDRMFDVGIAEQHGMTSAAGLALGGLHPVLAIYSTFLNRAFDQLLMDVALLELPVTLVLDRAGITGPDGPSHHGMWDLSLMSIVPGMRVAAPRDAERVREELGEALAVGDGPTALRFPKGAVPPDIPAVARCDDGVDVLFRPDPGAAAAAGKDVLIVAVGAFAQVGIDVATALAGRGIAATVVDPRWVLPVAESIVTAAREHRLVVTLEDGGVHGGVGAAVHRALSAVAVDVPVRRLGIPQEFVVHSTRDELLADFGLTSTELVETLAGDPALT
ncbi:MAG: 1-deoxy-D-xylulose-5-phosphate synthase [Gordonia sp. (in: high G+C Gram-positive bacteria)]|uniref:1-deoxy-D-xylulose-5-phosphate synthase n=1 Tax=Gordonia sp. (in: high G+C Gram-positive bacteria) TaxID=84139 RepID=UPI0039E5F1FB